AEFRGACVGGEFCVGNSAGQVCFARADWSAKSRRSLGGAGRRGVGGGLARVQIFLKMRPVAALASLLALAAGGQQQSNPPLLSVCELSKDYGAYRGKLVAVRGVYYYGLRQTCSQKCAEGPWPSFIELVGAKNGTFDGLSKVEQSVGLEAKKGKRFEIWVTAVGQLETMAAISRLGPCDKV